MSRRKVGLHFLRNLLSIAFPPPSQSSRGKIAPDVSAHYDLVYEPPSRIALKHGSGEPYWRASSPKVFQFGFPFQCSYVNINAHNGQNSDFVREKKQIMALFSFRHSVKTFSTKSASNRRAAKIGQTSAHLRYITRPSAARTVIIARLKNDSQKDSAEAAEMEAFRSEGRVCERFTVALPIEATSEQREILATAYAEYITLGQCGYVAAIHDKTGNDMANPHFHLVCFDKKMKGTGRGRPRSIMGMSRKFAIESAAHGWASVHNSLMSEWGYGEATMIDHRSFSERGIDRVPTIHEGPGAKALEAVGSKPVGSKHWQKVDGGHTRAEANKLIGEINHMKEELYGLRLDRLGSSNAGNTFGDARDGPKNSKNFFGDDHTHRRAGKYPPAPSEIGRSHQATSREDRGTRKQPFKPQERIGKMAPPPFASRGGKGRAPSNSASLAPSMPWGRVRRIYRELVLTRDTLKTRLLRYEAQSQILAVASDLTSVDEKQSSLSNSPKKEFQRER